jgi:hypothetical protein
VKELAKPEEIQALIAKSFESRLPQAIHDATGELVGRLVDAEVHRHLGPTILGQLAKSAEADGDKRAKLSQNIAQDPKGLLYDPFTALDQMGFRERPTAITFRTLNEMARRCTPIMAIVQTRLNQMAAFADPQPDEHGVGFKVVLKDRRAEMSAKLQKRADEISRWIVSCGHPELKIKRDRFGAFIRKSVYDSMVYDQFCAEIIQSKDGEYPAYWRALDASTIRISDTLDEVDYIDDSIQYVQVYDNTIIAEFTEEDLIFGVRNPRSDIRYSGYGQSELETLITIVTAMLWGVDYNAKFFTQGSVAKGLLNFKGAVPEKELIAFRRNWYSMITGVQNAFRTPVLNAEDVQWINMQQSNRDMEFSGWIDWLLKVSCAVYQIAPEEIGFQFGNTGQSSSMSEGSQESKLKYSRDKGLVPLAKFFVEQMNDKVVRHLDDRFKLEFAGINARDAEALIELQAKEVSSVKTVNEARKERGLQPLPKDQGDVILNPTWIQWAQAREQAAQQGAGGMGMGIPGSPNMDQGQLGDSEDGSQDDSEGNAGAADREVDQEPGAEDDGVQKSFGLSPQQARAMTILVDV